jgi:hypothetical protein
VPTSTAAGSVIVRVGLDQGVTLVWFVIWLIWNNVGDKEPLTFDPVNWWAGLLLLAVALDLGGGHAHAARR